MNQEKTLPKNDPEKKEPEKEVDKDNEPNKPTHDNDREGGDDDMMDPEEML